MPIKSLFFDALVDIELIYSSRTDQIGAKFDCQWMSYLEHFNLTFSDDSTVSFDIKIAKTFLQVKFGSNLPIVSAVSDNHFDELNFMIGTAQKIFPQSEIVVYDLGLDAVNTRALNSWCHVSILPFNFTAYPSYVKYLFQYRWKPLIWAVNLNKALF